MALVRRALGHSVAWTLERAWRCDVDSHRGI